MTEKNAIARYMKYAGVKEFNIKSALVDCDGVLYDSMKNHSRAWVKLMTKNGIKCSRDEFYQLEGMVGTDIIKTLFKSRRGRIVTDDEAAALYKVKGRYFTELGEVPMISGTLDVLNALKGYGINSVLVTGSQQASLLERIERDYPGIFEGRRVTGFDVKHGKPNPEPYLKGISLAGV